MFKRTLTLAFFSTLFLTACSNGTYTPHTISDGITFEANIPVGELTKDEVSERLGVKGEVVSFSQLDFLNNVDGQEIISIVSHSDTDFSVIVTDSGFSKTFFNEPFTLESPGIARIQAIIPYITYDSHFILIEADYASNGVKFAVLKGGEEISIALDNLFGEDAKVISNGQIELRNDGLSIKRNGVFFDYFILQLGEFTSNPRNLEALKASNVDVKEGEN